MSNTEVRNDWLACKVAELKDMFRSSSHTLQQSADVTHTRLKNVVALRQQRADTMVGVQLSCYGSHATGL
jgi:hypothetical protein